MSQRIDERITERYAALSPQERRAAETLLEHLDDLATYRSAELADLAGVSKATMSRLFRSLGFTDFDEVRDHLRGLRSAGEPRRVDGAPSLVAHEKHEAESIRQAVESPAVAEVVRLLAAARRVLVVGWRNSHPVALHLRQQLSHARGDVRLAPLPGQVLGEELADLGTGDVIVVVGFRRRPSGFAAFLTGATATGATVVLVADPTARQHATYADHWLECPVASTLAFDSYAAAMSLVSVLADGVLCALGRPARDRISEITRTYARLAEVE
ncbi:MurR/RpiR family transcriptional regulator [Nocardioides mangrovi]|uniref:MurR/RpiR family transcriptional regulator n=1 Tax=Nocardioides mangrovi TaxID=2874580 RepID=A0ABS7UG99_9ACTN|nr:MurR/RpiR family transcriptional regulator [Nocardioides mangrovi]MBZ5740058.1 MurR/RpiR family transcriptional regulator [Nocardioides mangrovi]